MKNRKIKMNRNEGDRARQRSGRLTRVWITLCSLLVVVAMGVVGVYAWFLKEYKTPGTTVTTDIMLTLQSYKLSEHAEGESPSLVRYLNLDNTSADTNTLELYNALQKDVGMFVKTGETDDVYFVIQKKEGCIPIDIRLAFDLIGLKNNAQQYIVSEEEDEESILITYVGGFYYQLQEVTSLVSPYMNATALTGITALSEDGKTYSPLSTVTRIEQGIYSFATTAGVENGGPRRNLNSISAQNNENESHTLRDSDYCVYRLTTGINANAAEAVCYGGNTFNIELTLVAAQKDGFLSHGTSQTYYVANESQLKTALETYAPGDSIVLTNNIEFNGDLVLTKPVNLYLNNGGGYRLSVSGNFIISYPYRDTFTINTENNGQIRVLKYNDTDGIFRVDLPLGSLYLTGEGKEGAGEADFYVQSQIFWKASCIPASSYASGTAGYGITMDHVLINQGTGADDQSQILHPIRLGNNTELTVSSGTKVGQIYPNHNEEAVERIVIVNYGTIKEQIDLSRMVIVNPDDGSYSRYRDDEHCPQIFIDNYGEITKAIRLPSLAAKFKKNGEGYYGNTRIIQQRSVTVDMNVVDNVSLFQTSDIEKIEINQNVIDVNKDGHNLIVYYADFSENHAGVTLQGILDKHISLNGTGDNYNTGSYSDIRKLTVVWQGYDLTAADYAFLHGKVGTAFRFENLTELDLAQAHSPAGKAVPDNAFNGMTKLAKVSLPEDATSIGASAFVGTSVKDLYLPKNMTTIGKNALGDIRGVHISNPIIIEWSSNIEAKDARRLFLATEGLWEGYTKAKSEGGGGYSECYCFKEATWLEGTDYYFRFVSGTDAELACYVGAPWTDTMNNTLDEDDTFVLTTGGKDYSITGIDPYAFYKKITASNATVPFTPRFNEKLITIGAHAFDSCTALGEIVDLGGCKIIEVCAFKNCTGLKQISGANVISEGMQSFVGCTALTKAVFPKSPLGNRCYESCNNLVVVEAAANEKAANAFKDCICLKYIVIHTENSTEVPKAGTYENVNTTFYNYGQISDNFVIIIDEKSIADPALGYNYFYLALSKNEAATNYPHVLSGGNFTAPEYVYVNATDATTEIRYTYNVGTAAPVIKHLSDLGYGDYVFGLRDDGHGGKEAVLLASLLDEVKGDYHVPDTITVMDNNGTHVYPVVEVNRYAFRRTKVQVKDDANGTIATTLTLGGNLRKIGDYAFYNLPFTGELDLNNVTSVGTYAFSKTGFTSAKLGKVSEMGAYAFSECASLLDLDCADATVIGDHGFYNCANLLYAKGEDILTVNANGFDTCSKLVQATFPNARLKTKAFCACKKLLVLESAVYASGNDNNVLESTTGLKLWIVHPDSPNAEKPNSWTYCANSGYNSSISNSTNSSSFSFALLFSQATSQAQAFYTAAIGTATVPNGNYRIYTTGNFAPEDYAFTNGGANTAYVTFADGNTMKRLSDLTNCAGQAYGDYVWGLDKTTHTATLLMSLVPTVGNSTTASTFADLPEYVYRDEPDGAGGTVHIGYKVTTLQENCFVNTTFTNCDVVIPDTLKTVGKKVFYSKGITGELHLKNVTDVEYEAFQYTKLQKVYLGKVSTMGNYAFSNCTELSYLDCEEATVIGTYGFMSCSALETVDFHGDDSKVTSIGTKAFGSCSKLKSVDARKVTSVGANAFESCTSLTYANLPEVTSMGVSPFTSCSKLETALLPKVVSVTSSAFGSCAALTTVDISSATSIGESGFNGCAALAQIGIDKVTSIGKTAFKGCTALEVIKGPKVQTIGESGFEGCSSLREALFPNARLAFRAFYKCANLTVLETTVYATASGTDTNAVIDGCAKLRYWYLNTKSTNRENPGETTFIDSAGTAYLRSANTYFAILVSENEEGGKNYFSLVSNTTTDSSANRPHILSSGAFTADQYVYVDASDTDTTVKRYKVSDTSGNTYYLSDLDAGDYVFGIKSNGEAVLLACLLEEIKYGYTVPDTITVDGVTYPVVEINKRAFLRVNFLPGATVSFGGNLLTIDAGAFYGKAIEGELALNNVTSVGANAFNGAKITTLGLGHVATIGTDAFKGVTLSVLNCDSSPIIEADGGLGFAATTVNLCHVQKVGKNKFQQNTKITTLNCGDCKELGAASFRGCTELETIDFGAVETTKYESYGSFHGCTKLKTVYWPNAVSPGDQVFRDCTRLETVTFGENLETLGASAFRDCTALKSIDLGDSIVSIGNGAFVGCISMGTADLGSLSMVPQQAFDGCTMLTTVLMDSVTQIDKESFRNCTSLANVDMVNVTTIKANAFENCPLTNLHMGKVSSISTDAFKGIATVNLWCDNCTLFEGNFTVFKGLTTLQSVHCGNVTKLGNSLFEGCTALETVDFGAVTSIGNNTFKGTKLQNIDLANVVTVGENAFQNCTYLTTVDFGTVETIKANAFNGCTNLGNTAGAAGEIDLENVKTIGENAFNGCSKMKVLHLGKTETVGTGAFTGCNIVTLYCDEAPVVESDSTSLFMGNTSLNVVLTGSIAHVGDNMFKNCTSLNTVVFGENVASIGVSAFEGCTALKNFTYPNVVEQAGILILPDATTEIGANAFKGCKLITVVDLNNVTTVGISAFENCTGLTALDLGLSETLGNAAFKGCNKITAIDLAGVKTIGDNTFANCSAVVDLHLGALETAGTGAFSGMSGLKNLNCGSSKIIEGDGALFKNNTGLVSVDLGNITKVGAQAFSGCSNITTLIIGDNVKTIGDNAFFGCSSLTAVDFNNVETIGTEAFRGCSGLTTILLPNVVTISDGGFWSCSALTEVTLVKVKSIGTNAFNGNSSLTTLHLGVLETLSGGNFNYVTTLYCDSAPIIASDTAKLFNGNKNLKTIYFCDVTKVGTEAFQGCTGLTSLDFANVETIGTNAFKACTGLTSLDFEGTDVTTIGTSAFQTCTGLTKVDFRDSNVTTLGSSVFFDCTGLTEAYMGNITSIPNNFFQGCSNLATIDLGEVTSIGDLSFHNCKSLNDVNFAKVTTIGASAFAYAAINKLHMGAVTTVGSYAFSSCSITYLYCDNNSNYFPAAKYVDFCQLTEVPANAFVNNTALEAINLRNVTTIGTSAFNGCTKLHGILNNDETVTEGLDLGSVTTLANYAFSSCTSLTAVNFRNVTTIGTSAFLSCTSLANTLNDDGTVTVGLDLKNVTTLSDSSFQSCNGLYYVTGYAVKSIGTNCFKNSEHLVKAVFPNATTSTYPFTGTPLLVLEVAANSFSLNYCNKIKLIILHPESSNVMTNDANYWKFGYSGLKGNDPCTLADNYVMLCMNDLGYNNVNYFAKINSGITDIANGRLNVVPTGSYLPSQYTYADADETTQNVRRVTYVDENGETKYLSDLGYGDYVLGVDAYGNATLFACLLDEIYDSYATPSTVTVGSAHYSVNVIGERAYSEVDITGGALTVADGVTTIGAYAFSDPYRADKAAAAYSITIPSSCTSVGDSAFAGFTSAVTLRLMGDSDSVLTASHILGTDPVIPADFTIYVRKTMIDKYLAVTDWADIPNSQTYFAAMDIVYQDPETDVKYYLVNNGDNTYVLTDIELPADFSADTLTLLSVYPGDGTLDGDLEGPVVGLGYNAMAGIRTVGIQTLILPASLKSMDHQNLIYPATLEAFVIDGSNAYYETLDGVLYYKGLTALLIYPTSKSDATFTLSGDVVAISTGAFRNNANLVTVTSATETAFDGFLFVSEGAFDSCGNLTGVTFGKSVIVCDKAFINDLSLSTVTYNGTLEPLFLGSDPYGGKNVTVTVAA